MARLGKCRCGTILQFEMTPVGYKRRCPECKAVVRLRVDAAEAQKSSAVLAVPSGPPPLPTGEEDNLGSTAQPDLTLDELPSDNPFELGILGQRQSTAPVAQAELEVYRDPERDWSGSLVWLFALLVLAVVAAVTTAVILWG